MGNISGPGGMTVSRQLKFSGFFKLYKAGQHLNGNRSTGPDGMELREFMWWGGYPLPSWLITPHENNGLLATISTFNSEHKVAMSLAVRAFSRLRDGWRILDKVIWRPDKSELPSITSVCCLLHNIVLNSGGQLHRDVALLDHHDSSNGEQCYKQVDQMGRTMRENLGNTCRTIKRAPAK